MFEAWFAEQAEPRSRVTVVDFGARSEESCATDHANPERGPGE